MHIYFMFMYMLGTLKADHWRLGTGTPKCHISAGVKALGLEIKVIEDNMAKTAVDLSENPGSADELVRDLEDSGYPVGGSREQFIRQPDGLAAATSELVAAPVQLDKGSAQRIRATPSEDESRSDGDVPNQGNAADSTREG